MRRLQLCLLLPVWIGSALIAGAIIGIAVLLISVWFAGRVFMNEWTR